MTDRYNYLTVALEQDIRSDDAEKLIIAIRMMRGVADVAPNVVDGTSWTAEQRVCLSVRRQIMDLLHHRDVDARLKKIAEGGD